MSGTLVADDSRWSRVRRDLVPLLTLTNGVVLGLALVVFVAGAILFMVLVGMVNVGSDATKDRYIEVTSQILNAVFTLAALWNQPLRFWLAVQTVRLIRGPYELTARYAASIQRHFPFVHFDPLDKGFLHSPSRGRVRVLSSRLSDGPTSGATLGAALPGQVAPSHGPDMVVDMAQADHLGGPAPGHDVAGVVTKRQVSQDARGLAKVDDPPPLDLSPAGAHSSPLSNSSLSSGLLHSNASTGSPSLFMPVRRFAAIVALLNANCITQYPITIVMWGWAVNYHDRPSAVVYAFLPLSFLSGTVGGIMLARHQWKLKKLTSLGVLTNSTDAVSPAPLSK